jgi:hypothetical protein
MTKKSAVLLGFGMFLASYTPVWGVEKWKCDIEAVPGGQAELYMSKDGFKFGAYSPTALIPFTGLDRLAGPDAAGERTALYQRKVSNPTSVDEFVLILRLASDGRVSGTYQLFERGGFGQFQVRDLANFSGTCTPRN